MPLSAEQILEGDAGLVSLSALIGATLSHFLKARQLPARGSPESLAAACERVAGKPAGSERASPENLQEVRERPTAGGHRWETNL